MYHYAHGRPLNTLPQLKNLFQKKQLPWIAKVVLSAEKNAVFYVCIIKSNLFSVDLTEQLKITLEKLPKQDIFKKKKVI